jgi:hypothetical protein
MPFPSHSPSPPWSKPYFRSDHFKGGRPPPSLRAHPKAPYLRLVVSQESPAFLHFGSGDLLQKMFDVVSRWRAANSQDYSRWV